MGLMTPISIWDYERSAASYVLPQMPPLRASTSVIALMGGLYRPSYPSTSSAGIGKRRRLR